MNPLKVFALWLAALAITFVTVIYFTFLISSSIFIRNYFEKDPVMQIKVRELPHIGFEESAELARRLTALTNEIDETGWVPDSGDETMQNWINEITPMFMYEGLVTETAVDFDGFFISYPGGYRHVHVGGESDCDTYILLNNRFFNPVSDWYQNNTWPITAAHELAHIQQGPACDRDYNSQNLLENSAQIMAWEVMAALANRGNVEATLSLVFDLRGTALSSARAMSEVEGRPEDFQKLLQEIYGDDASKMASIAKNRRYWADKQEKLRSLTYRYGWSPLNLVFMARDEKTVYQLAINNETHSAEIDDLIYFFEHMEELVGSALEKHEDHSSYNRYTY